MNTVIHYPNAPTPEWLRLAALCWDKVYWFRFYNRMDDDRRYRFHKDLGPSLGVVLEEINGDEFKIDHPELAKDFYEWICSRAWQRFRLNLQHMPSRYGTHSGFTRALEKGKKVDPYLIDSIMSHYSYQLRDGSRSSEIAHDEDEAVFAQAQGLYALEAAKAAGSDLSTTDNEYTEAIFHDYKRVVRSKVVQHVIKAYIPENLSSIAPEKIAELRSELSTQRLEFQEAIQKICPDLANPSWGAMT